MSAAAPAEARPEGITTNHAATAPPTVRCRNPAQATPSAAATSRQEPPPSTTDDPPPVGEAQLLRSAWIAIENGDAFTALRALEEHTQRFADGVLAEERDALWIRALVDIREYEGAKERASRFHERHPESIHEPAVRRALAEIP